MAVWNLDLKVCATAYVVADTAEEAMEKLRRHFTMDDGTPLETLDLEVDEGCAGDFEISGAQFDDPDLPEICLSPAMTIYAPEAGDVMEFVDDDGEEVERVADFYGPDGEARAETYVGFLNLCGEAAEYVERFAELTEAPKDSDCWRVLAELRGEPAPHEEELRLARVEQLSSPETAAAELKAAGRIAPGEFVRCIEAGYRVDHEYTHRNGSDWWSARDPDDEGVFPPGADFWPSERAAWEACDRHRMFGNAGPAPAMATDGPTLPEGMSLAEARTLKVGDRVRALCHVRGCDNDDEETVHPPGTVGEVMEAKQISPPQGWAVTVAFPHGVVNTFDENDNGGVYALERVQ